MVFAGDQTKIVSGAYSCTWNGLKIGNLALGGLKVRHSYVQKEINFDAVGLVPVDTLYTGAVMMIDFVCMQYQAPAIAAMKWPMGALTGYAPGQSDAAGFAMFNYAKPFVMTSCNSTQNPQTRTFPKTILAPNFEVVEDNSAVIEKALPIRLMVFPVASTGTGTYATPPTRPMSCNSFIYYTETLPDDNPAVVLV